MQRLGRALHVGQSQNVIIAVENVPKLGGRVVDENLKPIGKVVDIFGPVSSPYASVKLTVQASKKLVDKVLYVLPSEKRKGKI